MFVTKNLSFKGLMLFTGWHIIWMTVWASIIASLYYFTPLKNFTISWLPISLIGTAVAFYVGFKNNQAYDRLWEARKIWGGIINSSRAWGSISKAYVSNQFTTENKVESDLNKIRKKLIYRHIAWLYSLRSQLLIPAPWEHINQSRAIEKQTKNIIKRMGVGLYNDDITGEELREHLPIEEYERLINAQNTATQIIDQQSQDLKELRENDLIDDFRHMEMQNILTEFYNLQGKSERIKKFPLPRQYGGSSVIFVGIFIALLPFGMASEFMKLGTIGIWLSIPFTVIVGWVYMLMELVGDYSENPFEGLGNDIPMLSICRTIEIDLKEMLGEKDLPKPIIAKNGVLM